MSPFAVYLKQLRSSRQKKQKDLAHELGYEPSYLSALERGEKGPPRQDFIQRLVRGLSLSLDEQIALEEALRASRRQFSIPHRASKDEFELIHELVPLPGKLHPIQIELIQLALSIPGGLQISPNRLEFNQQEEDIM